MRIAPIVIVVVLLPVLSSHAGSGRVVIAEGGKHRILVVDRESRVIVTEKSDFRRVDCLAALAADALIVCDSSQFVRLGVDLTERARTPVAFERVGSVTPLGSDQLLVSDVGRHAVVLIDGLGNELSSIPVHFPSNVVRLPPRSPAGRRRNTDVEDIRARWHGRLTARPQAMGGIARCRGQRRRPGR